MPFLVKCGSTKQSSTEGDPWRPRPDCLPPGCSNPINATDWEVEHTVIDISGNCYDPESVDFTLYAFYVRQFTNPLCNPGSGTINVLLAKNSTSDRGPFVNAVEIYSVQDVAGGHR